MSELDAERGSVNAALEVADVVRYIQSSGIPESVE